MFDYNAKYLYHTLGGERSQKVADMVRSQLEKLVYNYLNIIRSNRGSLSDDEKEAQEYLGAIYNNGLLHLILHSINELKSGWLKWGFDIDTKPSDAMYVGVLIQSLTNELE